MNDFFQNHLMTIIVFLLIVILVLIALIGFIVVKLLLPRNEASTTHLEIRKKDHKHPPIQVANETVVEKFSCHHHPEVSSTGSCLICEDVFCDNCLVEHENLYFCKEHFKVFANHKWKQITDVKTTPDTPTDGLFVYNFKRHLWTSENTPSFILTHYKINLEQDYIESFVQLNVRDEDAERLEVEIKKFQTPQ